MSLVRSFVLALLAGLPATLAAQHAEHAHGAAETTATLPDDGVSDLGLQLDAVRQATARFRDLEVAKAEGYRRFGRAEQPLVGEHWYRKDLVTAPLDLERPSTLMYARIDGEPVLVGLAYTVYRAPHEPLPGGFAGDDDVWHVHDVPQLVEAIAQDRPFLRRMMQRRVERAGERTHLTMLHAWVWLDNPEGVFALYHRALPYVKAGLPAEWAGTADEAAARGAALLEPEACGTEVAALNAMARLSGEQRGTLEAACEGAAADVRAAREAGLVADGFNEAASEAWRAYVAARDTGLTAEQRARMGALHEHVSHADPHAAHAP